MGDVSAYRSALPTFRTTTRSTVVLPISMAVVKAPTGPNVLLRNLLTAYRPSDPGESADVRRLLELSRVVPDVWSQELPVHVTSSAVVVHPPTRRVLLRWHSRQQAWLQIGGHGDPGEVDPLGIALREGCEETGLADLVPWPDADLVHVVMCAVPAKGDSPAHLHGDVRFVLATACPDDARPERPDAALRWLTVAEARSVIAEDNLSETIRRVDLLLG